MSGQGRPAASHHHRLLLALCLFSAIFGIACSPGVSQAETANFVGSIRTIFIARQGNSPTAKAVKERLIERLKKSGVIRVVDDATSADAVLHCNTVIWPTGT